MSLLLVRTLADQRRYDPEEAGKAYLFWLDSGPFDCGLTVAGGLRGRPNPVSQGNGAMMRISPLGIFGANHAPELVAEWAQQDASITHPHPVCQQANSLFTMAIAQSWEWFWLTKAVGTDTRRPNGSPCADGLKPIPTTSQPKRFAPN
jgi:ADP-ribosylglycohydrolase